VRSGATRFGPVVLTGLQVKGRVRQKSIFAVLIIHYWFVFLMVFMRSLSLSIGSFIKERTSQLIGDTCHFTFRCHRGLKLVMTGVWILPDFLFPLIAIQLK
jgi:hypothetical protein